MEIVKKFFPKIIPENDANYFAHLEGVISSVDELSSMQITKNPHSYQFRIAPSLPKYTQMLLEEILKLHNLYRIKLNLSKSIRTSSTIFFEIPINQ